MKAENIELLKQGTGRLGVTLSEKQLSAFVVFVEELSKWNEKINLTTITEEREIVIKHFLDSISCLVSNKIKGEVSLVDIGSGAGFPGLPLAIVREGVSLSLLEPVRKKAEFLKHLCALLGLRAEVLVARAEDLGRTNRRAGYQVAVARAVALLPVVCEYGLPLIRRGGWLMAQKAKKTEKELDSATRAAAILGGASPEVVSVAVPFLEAERYLVLVEKTKDTPEAYPRRVGIPQKRPLGDRTEEKTSGNKRNSTENQE